MGDNTERPTGEIPEMEGFVPLQPEEDVTTVSPITKNKTGKVSNNDIHITISIIFRYLII